MEVNWNLTSEIVPDHGIGVIFCVREEVEAGYFDARQRVFIVGIEGAVGYNLADVTHWMPFPEPPSMT